MTINQEVQKSQEYSEEDNSKKSERKRSRIELIADILRIINEKHGRIKPTHLMYKANLSHKQMKLYLEELEKKKMIKKEKNKNNDKSMILISPKGIDFFIKYKQMQAFEETFGL